MDGQLAQLLRDTRACVERLDPGGKVLFAAGAVEALRGLAAPLRVGQEFTVAVGKADRERVLVAIRECQATELRRSVRYQSRRRNGRGGLVTTDLRREPGGTVVATTRRWSPAEGYASFIDAIQEAIDRGDERYGVLLIELREIGRIAGAHGFRRAEDLFAHIAGGVEGVLQQSDRLWPVARDQLGILMQQGSVSRMEALARDIGTLFRAPVTVEEDKYNLSPRIGVSMARSRYHSAEQLLVDAEFAAHRAQGMSKPAPQIFNTSFLDEDRRQLSLAGALGPAIRGGELTAVYQPIVDLKSRRVYGFEVLSRWIHPTLGFVSPAEFVPMAEEMGLVGEMDERVLRSACEELRSWGAPADTHLSANVSGRQADDLQLVDRVRHTLELTGFDPGSLRLEVTETAVVKNPERCRQVLDGLHGAGVSVAMDDFGTGYASFRQLVEMPLDILKVDRAFVERIGVDPRGTQIVRAMISMAHQLGMGVVAEGVETKEQLDVLLDMNCDYAQGYYFAKPLAPEVAKEWVAKEVSW
jgi:Amt family ammonium transporter